MKLSILLFSVLALIPPLAQSQNRHRQENRVLLGVVTGPHKKGVEVLHVLEKSPADKAGLKVGDVLTEVADAKLEQPMDLDDALRDVEPGAEVELVFKRKKKGLKAEAKVIERKKYKGDFLKQRARGATGYEAPEWFAYEWGNVAKREEPPTLASTEGKVVVIHAFQGW